jgi:hypothetical protein
MLQLTTSTQSHTLSCLHRALRSFLGVAPVIPVSDFGTPVGEPGVLPANNRCAQPQKTRKSQLAAVCVQAAHNRTSQPILHCGSATGIPYRCQPVRAVPAQRAEHQVKLACAYIAPERTSHTAATQQVRALTYTGCPVDQTHVTAEACRLNAALYPTSTCTLCLPSCSAGSSTSAQLQQRQGLLQQQHLQQS